MLNFIKNLFGLKKETQTPQLEFTHVTEVAKPKVEVKKIYHTSGDIERMELKPKKVKEHEEESILDPISVIVPLISVGLDLLDSSGDRSIENSSLDSDFGGYSGGDTGGGGATGDF